MCLQRPLRIGKLSRALLRLPASSSFLKTGEVPASDSPDEISINSLGRMHSPFRRRSLPIHRLRLLDEDRYHGIAGYRTDASARSSVKTWNKQTTRLHLVSYSLRLRGAAFVNGRRYLKIPLYALEGAVW